MKASSLFIAALLAAALPAAAADDKKPPKKPEPPKKMEPGKKPFPGRPGGRAARTDMLDEDLVALLKPYDKNGDFQIDIEEFPAIEAEFKKYFSGPLKQFDRAKDGKLDIMIDRAYMNVKLGSAAPPKKATPAAPAAPATPPKQPEAPKAPAAPAPAPAPAADGTKKAP
ncbi:MAG TPA: hypothetical protein VG796_16125 [Verrucomicrobiales bacterium]|jgi:hypothetical protein|nr:hypothetical protein [Verrucomicrobiales bacterium]